jgi:branched-chain amino acid transport system permease protein
MKIGDRLQGLLVSRKYLSIILVCIGCALISLFIGTDRYSQRILLLIILWAAASSSFNIISGYGGQVVFGYSMYVGTGAYTSVLLFKLLGVSPWLGMWVGVIIAVIIAFIIGLPTLRLHGAYFAVATIAFPLITVPILNNLGFEEIIIPFTGHGALSMQFTDLRYYVLICVLFLAGVLLIIQTMECSRFGYALKAINQNETAAEGMGIDTYWTKMTAFLISAGLGAIAGTLYSFGLLYVLTTFSGFGLSIIVKILSITIVGGIATLWGPLIAAIFLVPIGEFLNAQFGNRYPGVQDIIFGAALILAIIYMREGIWVKIRGCFRTAPQRPTHSIKLGAMKDMEKQGALEIEPIKPRDVESNIHDPILKIEGIWKSFGGVLALEDVGFDVPRGKIVGIIGPNGAGKTTLFNVINGYLKPEKGKIFFEGKDVTYFKPHDLCRLGVGRTFQVAQTFGKMTVLENVLTGAFSQAINFAEAHRIAGGVVQQMGLAGRAYDQAVGLTIWETKSLEFSRALATKPKLLLVDEPMAGLNPEEANQIAEMIKSIAKSGITVIVIEHVVQNLVKIADWMIGLDDGRKVTEGTPQQVISNPHMIEAYLGAKWRERHVKS